MNKYYLAIAEDYADIIKLEYMAKAEHYGAFDSDNTTTGIANTITSLVVGVFKVVKLLITRLIQFVMKTIKYIVSDLKIFQKITDGLTAIFVGIFGKNYRTGAGYAEAFNNKINLKVDDIKVYRDKLSQMNNFINKRLDLYNSNTSNNILLNVRNLTEASIIKDLKWFDIKYVMKYSDMEIREYLDNLIMDYDQFIIDMEVNKIKINTIYIKDVENAQITLGEYSKLLDAHTKFMDKWKEYSSKLNKEYSNIQRIFQGKMANNLKDDENIACIYLSRLIPFFMKDYKLLCDYHEWIKSNVVRNILTLSEEINKYN